MSCRTALTPVLNEAPTAYRVDTDAITIKVKQESAASEKVQESSVATAKALFSLEAFQNRIKDSRTTTMGGIEAQSGFYYQNVLGALRALDLIEFGSALVSVSFDNPAKAESIDDIVAEGVVLRNSLK